MISTRAASDFGFSIEVAVPPGSQAMSTLRKALAASAEEDSDIYFVLKSAGQQVCRPLNYLPRAGR